VVNEKLFLCALSVYVITQRNPLLILALNDIYINHLNRDR